MHYRHVQWLEYLLWSLGKRFIEYNISFRDGAKFKQQNRPKEAPEYNY